MPISPGLGLTVHSGVSYYRITSRAFHTASSRYHAKVVNGEGAVRSRHGARYNYPGARTVYVADTPVTCFAEKMFYFHREVLTAIDSLHLAAAPIVPPFQQRFVLWDVTFRTSVANVFDLSVANAPAAGVFPCLLLNPSQDYRHLKDRRAAIQAAGYNGLRAPSTRNAGGSTMTVLFDDQSRNVGRMIPYEVDFRLITPSRRPTNAFASHATDLLDYLAGEVRVIAPPPPSTLPASLRAFSAWTLVSFSH
jgi:hypothetical protein